MQNVQNNKEEVEFIAERRKTVNFSVKSKILTLLKSVDLSAN